MLTHPTHDRLVALGLTGMAKALAEQQGESPVTQLGAWRSVRRAELTRRR